MDREKDMAGELTQSIAAEVEKALDGERDMLYAYRVDSEREIKEDYTYNG